MARLDLVNLLCLRADGLKREKQTNGVSAIAGWFKAMEANKRRQRGSDFLGFFVACAVACAACGGVILGVRGDRMVAYWRHC